MKTILRCFVPILVKNHFFQIYIYQRWIYRVDPKRVNEFGTSMENPAGAPEEENLAIEGTQPVAGPSDNQGTANEEADQEPKKTK